MAERGTYGLPDRGRQLLRFDGLCYDYNITPMDIDCLIEYLDKKRVLIEIKLKNTPVPTGERTALERMVKDFGNVGKESIAIVADHTVFDAKKDVNVCDCIVREIYHSKEKQWRPTKHIMTVKMIIDAFLST